MRRVAASGTQQVTHAADRLKRAGVDLVDLGAGEPDFATPAHIARAGIAAIEEGFTKYTPNAGIVELREAICHRYLLDYGVRYDPGQVLVTAGGKQALFNAALVLAGPGDEVITHTPGWPSLIEQVRIAEAQDVVVQTHPEDGFRLDPQAVLAAIGPRTKAVVINSPCNPTGALVSETDLAEIADEAATQGIWIVLDLCYEQLIYDEVPHNLPKVLAERHPDRSVVVGSLSKRYAMTGWRGGWAIGPPDLIAACSVIQSHATSNVSAITQRAGVAALTGPQDCVEAMRDAYRQRRDVLLSWLDTEARLRCTCPQGAFYLFPDVSDLLSPEGTRTSAELAHRLLEQAHVAVTPGEAFDAPGFLRLSYAAAPDRLEEGVTRLKTFLASFPCSTPA